VHETEEEIRALQEVMDATMARANPHHVEIVKPERRLDARQVVTYLQGLRHVAFGTVNAAGEPRVAPLDGHFVRGRFTLSTGRRSARWRNLERNPACSAAHYVGDDVAVVVNGRAEELTRDHPDHDFVHRIWAAHYESDPYSWGADVVLFRVVPESMWAYAATASAFPHERSDTS
jgi:pyridoxamine 5'-phosphate oxidase-like protein